MFRNLLFRGFSLFRHAISAWNTGGEGIHSPLLFYLVRYIFYETAQMYAWESIEQCRQGLFLDTNKVHIQDYGTGRDRDMDVKGIAQKSLMGRSQVQLLARVVHYMSGKEYVPNRVRPLHILELGTSLGITTAYLSCAEPRNKVVTFEGCEQIAEVAEANWKKLGIGTIRLIRGPLDETLINYAREETDPVDFVLMDANHKGEATLRYFEWLLPLMDKHGIIVLDDIRYSKDMYEAWIQIVRHDGVTATMDLGQMGLVFLNPAFQQKAYKIRI